MPVVAENPESAGRAPSWTARTVLWAGVVVCALGGLALVGWIFDFPVLRGLGADSVPMAPSTALLFIAQGLALGLHGRPAPSRRATVARAALAGAAGAAALALLVLSSLGLRSRVEHLGLGIAGDVLGVPVGFISPVTAALFLLASVTSLISGPRSPAPRLRRVLSLGTAGVLVGTSVVFLLVYAYGKPLLYAGGFIPPAMNTIMAFTVLGAGLLIAARGKWEVGDAGEKAGSSRWLLVVFALLAVAIVGAGQHYYREHERGYLVEVRRQLAAIADLKVTEITQWRRERLGDGDLFFRNDNFSERVERCVAGPEGSGEKDRLAVWLRQARRAGRYDRAVLFDAHGVEIVSDPPSAVPATRLAGAVEASLRAGQVTLLDLHRDEPGLPVHLSVLVPIFAPREPARPLGMLLLRIDPSVQLYPIIKRWPTASRTAETLLVRREGDDVLFLNEPRFRRGAALSFRVPLTNERTPAVRAALGQQGSFEGVDYRGVPVLAELRSVPDSPWSLVALMDAAEVYAPLKEHLWQAVLFVATLIFGLGAALGFVWRQQATRFYRERYAAGAALRASEAELRQRNDELTRFSYTVSHDLKSPLVTIQTFLGYLEEDLVKKDAASVERDFGFIRNAAHKMSRLLDEILQLSRVGRIRNPPVDLPLQSVVEEALGLVAGRVASRGVRIEVTPAPVVLHGDRVRLVEVFQNLLDNAVKFMGEQPSPLIEIGAEQTGGEIVLFVRDNGAGIDPRHMTKLFGLFEKLEPKSEGTGVGLALVRRIVEVHDGRIWAESAGLGQGACFRFTLAGTRAGPIEEAP